MPHEVISSWLVQVPEAEHRASCEADRWVFVPRADVPPHVHRLLSTWPHPDEVQEAVYPDASTPYLADEEIDPSEARVLVRRWRVDWLRRARHVYRAEDPRVVWVRDFPGESFAELYALVRRLEPRVGG